MLGVSQPGNTPSSLRHSASFSCLQRGTAGEGHRARTSTLVQQPSLQLSGGHHQYTSGQAAHSLLQQHQQQQQQQQQQSPGGARVHRETLDPVQDGNDYGFVRIRPRLRSTNATLYHEEEVASAKSALRERDAAAFSDRECDSNFRDCTLKVKDRDLSPKGAAKNQNPLRGALILFSTSSWWKARQREEQLNATGTVVTAPSSERKWSSTSMASPSNERKWQSSSMTSPTNERKWSVGNSLLTSPSNERKWTRSSVSSTSTNQQDRKWRSLGALLRTPGSGGGSSSHTSQNCLSHNMSVSMIEGDHFRDDSRGTSCSKARYQQPTSYSARVSRVSRDVYRENTEFGQVGRSKVSRRLYQDSESTDRELDEGRHAPRNRHQLLDDLECRGNNRDGGICRPSIAEQTVVESRGTTSTRSSRAQSFYLLDDFLRPQPQTSGKCMLNLYLSPSQTGKSVSNSGEQHGRSCEVRQACQANVSNITPPRRHNSSSDSLEVATSPLPPPVPPPPPQANAVRERERNENPKDSKDVCPCKLCWTNMQRSFVEEISYDVRASYGRERTRDSRGATRM